MIQEGRYTSQVADTTEYWDFYNSKRYYYKKNGNLASTYSTKDGQAKTAYFDRNKKLSEIRYKSEKSSAIEKIEFYKKGQLKKTRIY